jgi:hypothetical protein
LGIFSNPAIWSTLVPVLYWPTRTRSVPAGKYGCRVGYGYGQPMSDSATPTRQRIAHLDEIRRLVEPFLVNRHGESAPTSRCRPTDFSGQSNFSTSGWCICKEKCKPCNVKSLYIAPREMHSGNVAHLPSSCIVRSLLLAGTVPKHVVRQLSLR